MLSAAQLLDELMGRDRDLDPSLKRSDVPWDHESVCRHFLCAFCPAELFTNTRSDLGPCQKIHDEALRKQYEESSRYLRVGYERDLVHYLESLLGEVERRIRRAHERVALFQSQQESGQLPGPSSRTEKVNAMSGKIDRLVEHIEELGSEGKVDEAQEVAKRVERMKREVEVIQSTPSVLETLAAQEKPMEVCEICGAFLIVGDKQARVDDHFMGKRHLGYARIKSTIAELREKLRKRSEEPDRERDERERKRRRGEEEKENGSKRSRDRDRRERSVSRGKRLIAMSERGSASRDTRRSRSRERRRSRSRDRRRSRSRDRRSHDRMERMRRSRSLERRPESWDRRSYRNRSESREREQERKSKEIERILFDEKLNRQCMSREKLGEVTNSEPVENDITTAVNGTRKCDEEKSEGEIDSDDN